jgi:hypothetical protein
MCKPSLTLDSIAMVTHYFYKLIKPARVPVIRVAEHVSFMHPVMVNGS